MRSQNSINNALVNLIGQILLLFAQFLARLYFVKLLGDTCNSLNGLFTNILSFLSVAELGIGNTTCFAMYKSLAEKDYNKTNQYLNLFKKIYRYIGLIILVLGLAVMPFLKQLVGNENMIPHIYLIYCLYLLKSCLTYWLFSYRSTLIEADQKKYLIQRYSYLFDLIAIALQIASLFIFKSFLLYIAIALVFVVANNLFVGWYVKRRYKFINEKPTEKLSKDEIKVFAKNIYGSSLYKFSGAVYDAVDSIVIAASSLSFLIVGYYSNYMLAFFALSTIAKRIINSSTASIGNFNVLEKKDGLVDLFKSICFVDFWIYGVFAVCAICLINPFIKIFFSSRSIMDFKVVVLIVISFITSGFNNPTLVFRDACGLFYKGRFRPVFSALLNIALSFALVYPLGLTGIILATVIANLLTSYWYDPMLIYKNVFDKKPFKYYGMYIFGCIFVCLVGAPLYYLSTFLTIDNIFVWVLYGIAFFIVTNCIFALCFFKTKQFKYLIAKAKLFFTKKRAK